MGRLVTAITQKLDKTAWKTEVYMSNNPICTITYCIWIWPKSLSHQQGHFLLKPWMLWWGGEVLPRPPFRMEPVSLTAHSSGSLSRNCPLLREAASPTLPSSRILGWGVEFLASCLHWYNSEGPHHSSQMNFSLCTSLLPSPHADSWGYFSKNFLHTNLRVSESVS